jgi:hypothetical protein
MKVAHRGLKMRASVSLGSFALLVVACGGFRPAALSALGHGHAGNGRILWGSPQAAPRSLSRAVRMVATRPTTARPPEALADTVFNFAFGSNLNAEKRQSRGVNGTGIVSRSVFPAVVKGFRLAFNLPMFPPVEPGMAALAKAREGEDDSCHGLLLELTNAEYQKMWASEGGLAARPPYEETVVEATTYDGRSVMRGDAMYMYMYIHIHTCIHAYIHACIQTYMHAYTYKHVHVCICIIQGFRIIMYV